MNARNIIGLRVRVARVKKGLSQSQLAKMIGVNQSAIAHIESGTNIPSALNVVSLSQALEVSTDHILGNTPADLVRTIVRRMVEMDPKTLEEVSTSLREAGYDPVEIGTRIKTSVECTPTNSAQRKVAVATPVDSISI